MRDSPEAHLAAINSVCSPSAPPETLTPERERLLFTVLVGFVIGTTLTLAGDVALRQLGIVLTPTSRLQRSLMAADLALWGLLCIVVGALAYYLAPVLNTRLVKLSRPAILPAAWLVGLATLLFLLGRTTPAWWLAIASGIALMSYAVGPALERWANVRGATIAAMALWWLTILRRADPNDRVIALSVIPLLALLAMAERQRQTAPRIATGLEVISLAIALIVQGVLSGPVWPALCLELLGYLAGSLLARTDGAFQRAVWPMTTATGVLLACIAANLPSIEAPLLAVGGIAIGVLGHVVVTRSLSLSEYPYRAERLFSAGTALWPWIALAASVAVIGLGSMTAIVCLAMTLAIGRMLTTPIDVAPMPKRWPIIAAFAVMAMAGRIAFWTITDRVWEDGLITVQHAENAVAGLGLTHHPAHGLVHGFTSPLNVLVPLAGELVARGMGMTALRIASVITAAVAVCFAGCLANHPRIALSTPALLFWLTYLALDHSQISFGIAGMETQIWICVLLGGSWALVSERPNWLAGFLVLAGLSRPEGLFWIALAIGAVAVHWGWRAATRLSVLVGLGLAPWIVFTTLYYGSPVPHTVVAKSKGYRFGMEVTDDERPFLQHAASELKFGLSKSFTPLAAPVFLGDGKGPAATVPHAELIGHVVLFLAALGGVSLVRQRVWPVPLFALACVAYLTILVRIIFAWYPLAILAIGAGAVAKGIDVAAESTPSPLRSWSRWPIALTLALLIVVPLPATFATEAAIQDVIENGVRRRVGLWLHDHAKPEDDVCVECLGYIGYYSRLLIHDYPGLSSPRATAALEQDGRERFLWPIVESLHPRWLVLRDFEAGHAPANYELVHTVEADPAALQRVFQWLPITTIDDCFNIYRRREPAAAESNRSPDSPPAR